MGKFAGAADSILAGGQSGGRFAGVADSILRSMYAGTDAETARARGIAERLAAPPDESLDYPTPEELEGAAARASLPIIPEDTGSPFWAGVRGGLAGAAREIPIIGEISERFAPPPVDLAPASNVPGAGFARTFGGMTRSFAESVPAFVAGGPAGVGAVQGVGQANQQAYTEMLRRRQAEEAGLPVDAGAGYVSDLTTGLGYTPRDAQDTIRQRMARGVSPFLAMAGGAGGAALGQKLGAKIIKDGIRRSVALALGVGAFDVTDGMVEMAVQLEGQGVPFGSAEWKDFIQTAGMVATGASLLGMGPEILHRMRTPLLQGTVEAEGLTNRLNPPADRRALPQGVYRMPPEGGPGGRTPPPAPDEELVIVPDQPGSMVSRPESEADFSETQQGRVPAVDLEATQKLTEADFSATQRMPAASLIERLRARKAAKGMPDVDLLSATQGSETGATGTPNVEGAFKTAFNALARLRQMDVAKPEGVKHIAEEQAAREVDAHNAFDDLLQASKGMPDGPKKRLVLAAIREWNSEYGEAGEGGREGVVEARLNGIMARLRVELSEDTPSELGARGLRQAVDQSSEPPAPKRSGVVPGPASRPMQGPPPTRRALPLAPKPPAAPAPKVDESAPPAAEPPPPPQSLKGKVEANAKLKENAANIAKNAFLMVEGMPEYRDRGPEAVAAAKRTVALAAEIRALEVETPGAMKASKHPALEGHLEAADDVKTRLESGHYGEIGTPKPAPEPAPAPKPQPREEGGAAPDLRLAETVKRALDSDDSFRGLLKEKEFWMAADSAYGGTRASGKYGPSDAYDAAELGASLHFQANPKAYTPAVELDAAKAILSNIENKALLLPPQRNRSGEKDAMQQFSTPPEYAYVAAWAAGIRPGDLVLEPSAGTGHLAVFGKNAGASVIANDLSERRAGLLRRLFPEGSGDRVMTEDAEQIGNILAPKIKSKELRAPTVVLMNPPFSRAAERMGDKKIIGTDLKHIDAAMTALAPGGRLVAITGRPLMGGETKTSSDWLGKRGQVWAVRANIHVARNVYDAYGTNFPTRLLVIEKLPPDGRPVVTGEVKTLEEMLEKLEDVRNAIIERTNALGDRLTPGRAPDEPRVPGISEAEGGEEVAVQPGVGAVGPLGGRQPGSRPGRPPETGDVGNVPLGPDVGPKDVPSGDVGGRGGRGGDKPGKLVTPPHDETPGGVPPKPDAGKGGGVASEKPRPEPGGSGTRVEKEGVFSAAQQAEWDERVARLRARIGRARTQFIPSGDDFEDLLAMARLVIESGTKRFLQFARKMIDAVGAWVKPYLKGVWTHNGGEVTANDIIGLTLMEETPTPDAKVEPGGEAQGSGVSLESVGQKKGKGGPIADDVVFEPYHPKKVAIKGAKKHPAPIVESSAMASVEPPDPTYTPNLPDKVVKDGLLSDIQLENVVYAGQSHEMRLPLPGKDNIGPRRGYFIGDGTGVGKGRQLAAIILDNFRRGRTKAVWITEKQKLFEDATRDWTDLGGDANELFNLAKVQAGAPIKPQRGILFTTYDTLKSSGKDKNKRDRLTQVVDWLGADFDGVIVFDEAHNMKNLGAEEGKNASQTAIAGTRLQDMLPNARVVYSSATGATDIENLAYAERLGLWGFKTPFANAGEFIREVGGGGVAALELVARDMKAMGLYLSRNISYNDGTPEGTVAYRKLEHKLTSDQIQNYDKMAQGWRLVQDDVLKALGITGADRRAKMMALSQFWGSHQRFFSQVMTSMKTPTVIRAIEKDLEEGRSVVIQLTNTLEANQKRALAKRGDDEDLEDFDMSPKETLMQYIENSFPVVQYEVYVDENGNERTRPAKDKDGNDVLNAEAVAARDALLDEIGASMRAPESPLDMIISHFGHDKVAEVTGRKQRLVWRETDEGGRKRVVENRGSKAGPADIKAFQDGAKRILIFSEAGGTGASYHADMRAKNQQQRSHYLLQPGWTADKAVQGLGRSHRSNQRQAPIFTLAHTDLMGEKRFTSTIARRLDQLGAITKGQRQAGSTGIFSAADNLESPEATEALRLYMMLIGINETGYMPKEEFTSLTGLFPKDLPPMKSVLNRALSMTVAQQNRFVGGLMDEIAEMVERRAHEGKLDKGVEAYKADSAVKVSEQVVHTHHTGADTKYVKLRVKKKVVPNLWKDVSGKTGLIGFERGREGRIAAVFQGGHKTDPRTGEIISTQKFVTPSMTMYRDGSSSTRGWEQEEDLTAAEAAWNAVVADMPKFTERDEHLISGVILPIWDRLKGQPNVVRVTTDDGERILGRIIPTKTLSEVLKSLGAEQPDAVILPNDEAIRRVASGEVTIKLVNGWEVKSVRVSNERRIEIDGPSFSHNAELAAMGVVRERIQFDTRYFIPTGEKAAEVYAAVVDAHPVAEVKPTGKGGFDPNTVYGGFPVDFGLLARGLREVARGVENVFRSGKTQLERMGVHGRRAARSLAAAQNDMDTLLGRGVTELSDGLSAFRKATGLRGGALRDAVNRVREEKESVGTGAMTGPGKALAHSWDDGVFGMTAREANAAGSYVLDPLTGPRRLRPGWDKYFPWSPRKEIMDDLIRDAGDRREALARHLVKTGQAKTLDEARVLVKDYYDEAMAGHFGGIEKPRRIKFPPDWVEPDAVKAIHNYLIRATRRIAEIKHFGQDSPAALVWEMVLRLPVDERPSWGAWKRVQGLIGNLDAKDRTALMERVLAMPGPPGYESRKWPKLRESISEEMHSLKGARGSKWRMAIHDIESDESGSGKTHDARRANAKKAMAIYDDVFHRGHGPEWAKQLNYFEGNFTGLTKVLTNLFNPALQFSGMTNIAATKRIWRTLKASRIAATDPGAIGLAQRMGIGATQFQEYFLDLGEIEGLLGKVTHAASEGMGVAKSDRAIRYVDAIATKLFIEDAVELARKENPSLMQRWRLEKMRASISDWGGDLGKLASAPVLNWGQSLSLARIIQRGVVQSQFGGGPLEVSPWMRTPLGRIAMRLHRFGYQQAKLVRWAFMDRILKPLAKREWSKVDFAPMLMLLGGHALFGELYTALKNALLGRERSDEEWAEIVSKGDLPALVERLMNDWIASSTFGMLTDSINPVDVSDAASEAAPKGKGKAVAGEIALEIAQYLTPPLASSLKNLYQGGVKLLDAFEKGKLGQRILPTADEWARREIVGYGRVMEAFENRDPAEVATKIRERVTKAGKPKKGKVRQVRSLRRRLEELQGRGI